MKISPDKATNSLVVVASQNDYRNLVRVIEKLDLPRRQVFVEAVLMEVDIDRELDFGISVHQGFTVNTSQGQAVGIVGTKYAGTTPPSFSITNLASYGGFLAGIQGPAIPALTALGLSVPSFGIVLHALQTSADVNVLSTPHLLTTDNEEAEITVGQNVPFQAGFAPQSLPGVNPGSVPGRWRPRTRSARPSAAWARTTPPSAGRTSSSSSTSSRKSTRATTSGLVINESTEEIVSNDPVLGPTLAKRTAKTTVVAKDQETVVIGGIMQDRTIENSSKVPVLGDIPVLGVLFRESTKHSIKTNLLLFLTPYIIRDSSDFRRIFEQKMAERQKFVEQFYGEIPRLRRGRRLRPQGGPTGEDEPGLHSAAEGGSWHRQPGRAAHPSGAAAARAHAHRRHPIRPRKPFPPAPSALPPSTVPAPPAGRRRRRHRRPGHLLRRHRRPTPRRRPMTGR